MRLIVIALVIVVTVLFTAGTTQATAYPVVIDCPCAPAD